MFSGNLQGTLQTVFSLGKALKVALRNNSGVLEGQNNGGTYFPLIRPVTSHSANFTAVHMGIHLCSNNINAQLPSPTLNTKITIKKVSTNTVTVLRAGSEEIEGVASSWVMDDTKESATFISDGTNWFII